MRTCAVRLEAYHRFFAVGLAIALLALASLCPAMLPAICATSHQQTCQSQPCWLLVTRVVLPLLLVFAWHLRVLRFTLPSEYALLLFRPPRRDLVLFL